jgi:hypothetical protein
VLQQPAHVDGGGHAVFRHAAALPPEVRRRGDALAGVDKKVAVTEDPGGKDRNGHKRWAKVVMFSNPKAN